ncbi:MAG: DUF4197 domain-containing protein [Bacteroidetes bacterium]|nr:DUF4197 domain-containing protein [Bacteroidota bacterium]
MKTIIKIFSFALLLPLTSCSQIDFNKIGKEIDKNINGKKPLTNTEIISGLKEALNVGSNNASSSASKIDGYFKHPVISIPFPPEAQQMENTLRSLGMGRQVNDFVMTINRSAEEAAKQAAPIFLDAIKNMTITDGLQILKGNDSAATSYLRKSTSSPLHDKFKPVIRAATQKVDVTKYWNPLVTAYDQVPFVSKVNPDLEEYITQKALSGLFYLVSQEESKIRKDPAARVTDILKKVFGN